MGGGPGCYYFPVIEEKIEACKCLMWGLMGREGARAPSASVRHRWSEWGGCVESLCWPAGPVLPLHVSRYSWQRRRLQPGTAHRRITGSESLKQYATFYTLLRCCFCAVSKPIIKARCRFFFSAFFPLCAHGSLPLCHCFKH